jgi:hypothetical protein
LLATASCMLLQVTHLPQRPYPPADALPLLLCCSPPLSPACRACSNG